MRSQLTEVSKVSRMVRTNIMVGVQCSNRVRVAALEPLLERLLNAKLCQTRYW